VLAGLRVAPRIVSSITTRPRHATTLTTVSHRRGAVVADHAATARPGRPDRRNPGATVARIRDRACRAPPFMASSATGGGVRPRRRPSCGVPASVYRGPRWVRPTRVGKAGMARVLHRAASSIRHTPGTTTGNRSSDGPWCPAPHAGDGRARPPRPAIVRPSRHGSNPPRLPRHPAASEHVVNKRPPLTAGSSGPQRTSNTRSISGMRVPCIPLDQVLAPRPAPRAVLTPPQPIRQNTMTMRQARRRH
jgi:hypothetical protein